MRFRSIHGRGFWPSIRRVFRSPSWVARTRPVPSGCGLSFGATTPPARSEPARRAITACRFTRRHETERRQAVAENPSLPLEGLRATVGVACDRTTIWERLARFDDFRQKNRSSPPSNSGPPPPPPSKSSAHYNTPASTPTASSSSTKPGSKPTGPGVTVGGRAASVSSNMSRTATG